MKYYTKKYIVHEILKNCANRDFSMLSNKQKNIRALNVRCVYDFDRALKVANWAKHKQNLYRSVATLKNIPQFTFNPKKRSEETSVWFEEQYPSEIKTYDLFFDFDDNYKKGQEKIQGTWEEVISEVRILKEYLEDYKVPYFLLFSGNKGFQIVVPGDYLNIDKIDDGNVFPHKTIVENIKSMLKLNFLDLANNGVTSRLMKIPYSLVLGGCKKNIDAEEVEKYDEEEMTMALPLKDEQLDSFTFEKMRMKSVMQSVNIMRRGNLERFEELSLEEKRRNVQNFIKMFSFK